MSELMSTSYSTWDLFRNCRKAAYWRYLRQIAPIEQHQDASFGTLVHQSLETWYRTHDLNAVLEHLDIACADRDQNPKQRRTWHIATAMMRGYAARYAREEFEVLALEKTFEGEIVNPETGAASRSFTFKGKVDGVVRMGDEHFILEHKTAAVIDESFLDRLWTDFRASLYAHYLEQALDIRIAGVLYNVLVKARHQQRVGEAPSEFEARRARLIARSKSGRCNAKQQLPETDDEFQARLAARYANAECFHREILFLSREQRQTLRSELWELTQAFLDARRRDVWYQNTSYCFQYRRRCPYFALCLAGGSQNVLESAYRHRGPAEEIQAALLE